MAESKSAFCEVCQLKQKSELASLWCHDCHKDLCDECIKAHEVSKLPTHHITTIAERHGSNGYCKNQTCALHSKPIDSYCAQHDQLLCLNCIQSEHSKCGNVLRNNDTLNGVNKSKALMNLNGYILSILENISRAMEVSNKSKTCLKEQTDDIKSKINLARQKINKSLDEIQTNLLNELQTKYNMAVSELDELQTKLKEQEEKVYRAETELKQLKTHASDTKTFVRVKIMTKSVKKDHDALEQIITNAKNCTLVLELSPNILSLEENLHNFGNISIATKPGFKFFTDLHKHEDNLPALDISKIMLTKLQDIHIQKGEKPLSICGCVILRNEMVVFTDSGNNRLIMHNINGKFEKELKFTNGPMNITVIEKDKIAVSYKFKTTHFDIINLSMNTIEKRISVSKTNWHIGLAFYNDKFYAAIEREGVKEITLDGTATNTFLKNVSKIRKLVASNKMLFYTRSSDDKIYCCDLTGNPVWVFSDQRFYKEYYSPSLTVDSYGQIFVVGYDTFVVLGISHDGKNCRAVLDNSDGLNRPNAIFYDQHSEHILICNKENGYAALFNVMQG